MTMAARCEAEMARFRAMLPEIDMDMALRATERISHGSMHSREYILRGIVNDLIIGHLVPEDLPHLAEHGKVSPATSLRWARQSGVVAEGAPAPVVDLSTSAPARALNRRERRALRHGERGETHDVE